MADRDDGGAGGDRRVCTEYVNWHVGGVRPPLFLWKFQLNLKRRGEDDLSR